MAPARRVVFTTFAGRRPCMSLLLRYVREFMRRDWVHEFHAWNFTRNPSDQAWLLEEVSEEARWSPACDCSGYRYHRVAGGEKLTARGVLRLRFRASSDAHLLLHDAAGDVAELVFGGWDNTCTAVRSVRQGAPLASVQAGVSPGVWNECELVLGESSLALYVPGGTTPLLVALRPHGPLSVSVSAWSGTACTWQWEVRPERVMHVRNRKSWAEYYAHYTPQRYPDSVVIKCDDDIVFIDPKGFQAFLRKLDGMGDALLAFPAIVNNGVCAHHMQRAGLLPQSIFGDLPYNTFEGRLWSDGRLCESMHRYFCANREAIVAGAAELPDLRHPQGDRISINFFAVRSEDLGNTFQQCGPDDEHCLSVVLPQLHRRCHLIVQSSVVAHLGFYRQRETGLDERACLQLYASLHEQLRAPEDAPAQDSLLDTDVTSQTDAGSS